MNDTLLKQVKRNKYTPMFIRRYRLNKAMKNLSKAFGA